ncbi:MAG: 2-C-methyl-D-erythritol 2,4-cyclodiphosphate synthase [Candidatus Zixiibacteriota bacterium]
MRIGQGYDVHRLVSGRRLIIGGVTIPHDKGLEGHSDADVLLHATMDALLGAAGLGDIGIHFPPSDDRFKDADSLGLLKVVMDIVGKAGWLHVENIDATLIAQEPKLSPYFEQMKAAMACVLDMDSSRINIKATTTELLGFVGRGEGIAAMAVCLVGRNG